MARLSQRHRECESENIIDGPLTCGGAKLAGQLDRGVEMKRVIFCALAAMPLLGIAATADDANADHVKASLISEQSAFVPGTTAWIGLRLTHEPHWHTYWINPGDSGLPTTLSWMLPANYKAGVIDWPTPQRFAVGAQFNFGYEGEILLPVAIDVPADAVVGSTAHIAVEAKWLACRDACVPGKASLSIDLPVEKDAAKPDPRWTLQFSNARLAQPQATAWKGDIKDIGNRIELSLRGPSLPPPDAHLDVMATQRRLFDSRPPTVRREGDALVIDAAKSPEFTTPPSELDVLVTAAAPAGGARGWRVRIPYTTSTTP
jgi:DsbC/DsbD-like thiol-disulfide interchange protein